MKVIEKGTDRKAEVNIFVEGQLSALEEYGEYIDPRDNAICAYVVLDEGHKPRVSGRFTGTVGVTCANLIDVSNKDPDTGCGLRYYRGRSTA
jgi:hypothetical protein